MAGRGITLKRKFCVNRPGKRAIFRSRNYGPGSKRRLKFTAGPGKSNDITDIALMIAGATGAALRRFARNRGVQ